LGLGFDRQRLLTSHNLEKAWVGIEVKGRWNLTIVVGRKDRSVLSVLIFDESAILMFSGDGVQVVHASLILGVYGQCSWQ
jgi:hypothetical protein